MTVSLNIIVWKPSGAVEVVLAGTPQPTALGGFPRLRASRFRGLISRLRRSGPALPRETGGVSTSQPVLLYKIEPVVRLMGSSPKLGHFDR